ncbi:MAG TPA: PEP-CTERM sorting domain-containing protein [Nitrospiria bacterium]|nr:PEP-CTERM sorting domain-containing protein [Nitrospiria bacterium]
MTAPGPVEIIDGTDLGSGVVTFNIDLTLPLAGYDFGFMNGTNFVPIALAPYGPSSLYGTYTFSGSDLVNFALESTSTNTVYTIADPANYATQIYSNPIDPSHSVNPVVTTPYYNTLLLDWNLMGGGYDPSIDPMLTLTQAINPYDGMAPVVPLPAAMLLFGSGLLGLAGWRRLTA